MNYSVFGGTGFVGGNFCDCFSENVIIQKREDRKPSTKNILYFISTVDNYNVFNNITLDVETNLKVLCEVLSQGSLSSTRVRPFLYQIQTDSS